MSYIFFLSEPTLVLEDTSSKGKTHSLYHFSLELWSQVNFELERRCLQGQRTLMSPALSRLKMLLLISCLLDLPVITLNINERMNAESEFIHKLTTLGEKCIVKVIVVLEASIVIHLRYLTWLCKFWNVSTQHWNVSMKHSMCYILLQFVRITISQTFCSYLEYRKVFYCL